MNPWISAWFGTIDMIEEKILSPWISARFKTVEILRGGGGDGGVPTALPIWQEPWAIKPRGHAFDLNRQVVILRHMSVTGG